MLFVEVTAFFLAWYLPILDCYVQPLAAARWLILGEVRYSSYFLRSADNRANHGMKPGTATDKSSAHASANAAVVGGIVLGNQRLPGLGHDTTPRYRDHCYLMC
jgi:hypothetical protein